MKRFSNLILLFFSKVDDFKEMELNEDSAIKKIKHKHSKHKHHRKHGCKKHKKDHVDKYSDDLGMF